MKLTKENWLKERRNLLIGEKLTGFLHEYFEKDGRGMAAFIKEFKRPPLRYIVEGISKEEMFNNFISFFDKKFNVIEIIEGKQKGKVW
jgi:hypothetical protein